MNLLFRRALKSTNPILRELNKTYGLSFFKSLQLLKKFGLHLQCKVSDIPADILDSICKTVETSFLADVDLKKNYMANTRRCASLRNHHAVFLKIKLKADKKDVD